MALQSTKTSNKFALGIMVFIIGFELVWYFSQILGKFHQQSFISQSFLNPVPIDYTISTGKNHSEQISFMDNDREMIIECNSLSNNLCQYLKTNAKISQTTYLFIPSDCHHENSSSEKCYRVISEAKFIDSQNIIRQYQPTKEEIYKGITYLSSKNYFAWLLIGFLVMFIFMIFKSKNKMVYIKG